MTIAECNKPVAENVKKIIDEKGLKQKVVAKKANFAQSAFNAMLQGRRIIKPCDVNAIAQALEIPVNTLYGKD